MKVRRNSQPQHNAIQGAGRYLVPKHFSKIECLFAMENELACRAALHMIRATIEEYCPPGVLMSEEQVNGHFGPTVLDEAEALSVAIVATVERLSFNDTPKPPASSIKS
jgi:hypothetical protein